MNVSEKNSRNSSIELLRILSACAVVVLHYNGMGHVYDHAVGLSKEIMTLLECLCASAVDIFIMISGYFLCVTNKRTWDKPLYLFLLLSIITSIGYVTTTLVGGGKIIPYTVVHSMIPPKNYFVLLYITLYIISPYLNIVLNHLSSKSLNTFIVLMLIVFSIYPTIMDSYQNILHKSIMGVSTIGAWGQQHGYNIINFSLCYCLGAYIRLNNINEKLHRNKILLIIPISVVGVYLWFKAGIIISHGSQTLVDSNALSYSNPFILVLSFVILLLFTNMHFQSKFINCLSKASFVCYLFNLIVLPELGIENFAQKGGFVLILHMLITVVSIYFVSWLIWFILDFCISPITQKIAKYHIARF